MMRIGVWIRLSQRLLVMTMVKRGRYTDDSGNKFMILIQVSLGLGEIYISDKIVLAYNKWVTIHTTI